MSEREGRRVAGCVFCRIVAGEIPCHRVYEDEQVLAFLDVGPIAAGHTLVIPKTHYARLDEMPGELAGACVAVVPRLSRAVLAAVGGRPGEAAFNLLQNNGRLAHQVVDHVHFHIIPKTEREGLGITWPAGELGGEQARVLREKIAAAM